MQSRDSVVNWRAFAPVFVLAGILFAAGVVAWLLDWRLGVDSAVYRSGAITLWAGEPLYDGTTLNSEPWWALLPFTYPPTAALLFTPLAPLPVQVAWGVLGAVSVLSLAFVMWATLRALPRRPSWLVSPGTLVVLTLILEPVWRTLFLGQINLILMALVVADVLVLSRATGRARRFGGVLIGVAGAVKIIPMVFVGQLLVTRRWADAARAIATFLGLQVLMYLLIPHDVTRYWGEAARDAGRTGPIYWAGNQSVNALFARLTDLSTVAWPLAIAACAVIAVPAALLVRRLYFRGDAVPAMLVTAFFGLMISPVSWSHHWVWAVPLIVFLLCRLPEHPTWRELAAPVSVAVVYVSCVLLWMRNGRGTELRWHAGEFVLGSAYLLVPVVLGTIAAVRVLRQRRPGEKVPT
ncbi:alpha-1,2-mannosyltransferase [Herbihabitans rhizosphaerae]|uniref:Alpha-1,2-mannosyltransferase n=1 Tax=Herbihabitans rhizosphaerae TaxID=1872711 RepID=A0A4V2ERS4_9PSEU|nr:glycosyltransferase 87 family protein [Herbihabitans rhizosphaerae]RZS33877.1 alpha-1,2-mannosyltransferase [Herbihabitans rhizosphaerae]